MKQHGFTLLEAIVALVLLTGTGMALLNWINTNLLTLQRVQQAQQRQTATRNALVFMETINPLENVQGEQEVGIYKIRWQAIAIESPKEGVTPGGESSPYEIGLYQTEVNVLIENQTVAHFTLQQMGSQLRQDQFQFNGL